MKTLKSPRMVLGIIVLILASFVQVFSMEVKKAELELPTLEEFLIRYAFFSAGKNLSEKSKPLLVSKELFDMAVKVYFARVKAEWGNLIGQNKVGGVENGSQCCPYDKDFIWPFVQKRVFDKAPKNLLFVGDIHGCLEAPPAIFYRWRRNGFLDKNFKILDKGKTFAMFFGDYVDRGMFGIEVIFALILFKLENWDNVCLLQGNHEADLELNRKYGFSDELLIKYDSEWISIKKKCAKLFRCFPQAVFVLWPNTGKDEFCCIQCCHGGIELTYNPDLFLQNHKLAVDVLKNICLNDCGLVWSDFKPGIGLDELCYNSFRGHGYKISVAAFNKYLEQMNKNLKECGIKLIAFFRAHQHPDCVCEKLEKEVEVYTLSAFDKYFSNWTGYIVVTLKSGGFEIKKTEIVLKEGSLEEISLDEKLSLMAI